MKAAIVMIVVLATLCQVSKAQCGDKVKWVSVHTKFNDTTGKNNRDMEERVVITINKDSINILPHNSTEDEMTGTVTGYECKWTDSKNGSTSFKATTTDTHGDVKHITVLIKGEGDKISILIMLEEMPGLSVELTGVTLEGD